MAKEGGDRGHAGARTQDLRLIRATLYRLSYTTPRRRWWKWWTGWPSGLRRQTQVLVSSEARVRTPLLSYLTGRSREKHRSRQDSNLQPLDPRSNALPLSHATAVQGLEKSDEGGVRTHASEEIAALTQRLRPLGHLATHPASKVHPLGFEPRTFAVLKRRHNQLDHGCPSWPGES